MDASAEKSGSHRKTRNHIMRKNTDCEHAQPHTKFTKILSHLCNVLQIFNMSLSVAEMAAQCYTSRIVEWWGWWARFREKFDEKRVSTVTWPMTSLRATFYRATACNATHGISKAFLSVCPSVRLSVEKMHSDKTKETCAHILIPHEMKDHSS